MTLLPSGKVLITGGSQPTGPSCCIFLASAELYDPTAGTFALTGSMSTVRSGHTATLLANGRVLIAAGKDNSGLPTSSTEQYDPITGIFVSTGSMATGRAGHSAPLLPNGTVLVAGGFDATFSILASAELYTPALCLTTLTITTGDQTLDEGSLK